MAQYWTPDDGHFHDERNLFDMALLAQEGIEGLESPGDRHEAAAFFLRDIMHPLYLALGEGERDLRMATNAAYFYISEKSTGITRNIGMYGLLDGFVYIEGPRIPLGFYVKVDAFETFRPPDYGAVEFDPQPFRVPIRDISFVETKAA